MLQLEAQELLVGAVSFSLGYEVGQFAFRSLPSVVELAVESQCLGVVRQDVEHVELEALGVEQQVLMLRVDVDKLFAQFAHLGKRCGGVVDEGTALARSLYLATQYALIVILQLILVEEWAHAVGANHEARLDDTLRCPAADGLAVGALAQQEADGSKDD